MSSNQIDTYTLVCCCCCCLLLFFFYIKIVCFLLFLTGFLVLRAVEMETFVCRVALCVLCICVLFWFILLFCVSLCVTVSISFYVAIFISFSSIYLFFSYFILLLLCHAQHSFLDGCVFSLSLIHLHIMQSALFTYNASTAHTHTNTTSTFTKSQNH